jgi:hypothetical protein
LAKVRFGKSGVPGGDGGAHLGGDAEQAYAGGTYLFLDADGNLVERSVQWCKLEISEDGLKLAIILPVGLVVSVGVVSAIAQHIAKRSEKRLKQINDEVKAMQARYSVPDMARFSTVSTASVSSVSRGNGNGGPFTEIRWQTRVVVDEPVEVDAAHG